MTLRETLNVLSVKTDIIELRVFVSDDECVENIGFEDCEYPKDIICFLEEKYLECEVTYVEMLEDDGRDRMNIDIICEVVGRTVYMDEEAYQDAIDLVYEKLSELHANKSMDKDVKDNHLDRMRWLLTVLQNGEVVYG